MTTKANFKGYRLIKQIKQAEFEYQEYSVKMPRLRSYYGIYIMMLDWDKPDRANFHSRSWKHSRKTQYWRNK
jgi:hypothetical protein